MSILIAVLTIMVAAVLGLAAFKIEPHWCSKDGRRMICRAQLLDGRSMPSGAWHEVRVTMFDETLEITARGIRARQLHGSYRVVGRSSSPPKKKEIFVLQSDRQVVLKIPRSSRAVGILEALRPEKSR